MTDAPLVFIHIPKTAGTSFTNYLYVNLGRENIAPNFVKRKIADYPKEHIEKKYQLYWGHCFYNEVNSWFPENARYVTFLRNPIDRVVSQFKSWKEPKNITERWLSTLTPNQRQTIEFVKTATLEEYVHSDYPWILDRLTDYQVRSLAIKEDAPSAMLESAKKNLEKFFFFGLVEKFNESIDLFRKIFPQAGFYYLSVDEENRSNIDVGNLTPKTVSKIVSLTKNDLELYEYATNLFNTRLKSYK